MTNDLTQVRTDLQRVFTDAGLFAFLTVPDVATPPMVYVAPGDPYVTRDGAQFGGEIVTCSAVCVVAAGVNDVKAENLDGLLLAVCDAVDASPDFDRGDVGQPGQIVINGQSHLAVAVEVARQIHRGS